VSLGVKVRAAAAHVCHLSNKAAAIHNNGMDKGRRRGSLSHNAHAHPPRTSIGTTGRSWVVKGVAEPQCGRKWEPPPTPTPLPNARHERPTGELSCPSYYASLSQALTPPPILSQHPQAILRRGPVPWLRGCFLGKDTAPSASYCATASHHTMGLLKVRAPLTPLSSVRVCPCCLSLPPSHPCCRLHCL